MPPIKKEEGATMECLTCKANLVCHMKDYGNNMPPRLQWQNPIDGSAHYKTTNGKDFTCNIPKLEENLRKEHARVKDGIESGEIKESIEPLYTMLRNFGIIEGDKRDEIKLNTNERFEEDMQGLIEKNYNKSEGIAFGQRVEKLIAQEHLILLKFQEKGIEPNVQKIGMYLKILNGVND